LIAAVSGFTLTLSNRITLMTLAFAPERIEHWPLARLRPYAKNAKMRGPDQVTKLAARMAEFGWTVPPVGFVYLGNTTHTFGGDFGTVLLIDVMQLAPGCAQQ
jgi:hypothetical protein